MIAVRNARATVEEIGSLRPHPRNARRGEEEVIRESIQENLLYRPIVAWDGTRYILAGRHTWESARAEGIERLPVIWVDVDEDTALRILAADNRTSDLAHNDLSMLSEVLTGLLEGSGSLAGTGYDRRALAALLRGLEAGEEDGADGGAGLVVLRLVVSPEDHGRFLSMLRSEDGEDDAERFAALMGRLP